MIEERDTYGAPDNRDSLHFRVLALDIERERLLDLEHSFTAMYLGDNPQNTPQLDGIRGRKNAEFFFARTGRDLADCPPLQTINTAWIHVEHPECEEIAANIYERNIFCCIVFYGEITLEKVLRLSIYRPMGYLRDVSDRDAVFRMLHTIWKLTGKAERRHRLLRLVMRDTFYNIPMDSIQYCESESVRRKCYLYIRIDAGGTLRAQEDGYVLKESGSNEVVAYIYNGKLDTLAQKLPKELFLRVHKSCLVNKRLISRIQTGKAGWIVVLSDGKGKEIQLPVSTRYHKEVKEWWEEKET